MKKKKSGVKILSVILVLFVIIIGVTGYLLFRSMNAEKESQAAIEALQLEIESNKQFVYVATDDLPRGTVLEENVNVEIQENVTALPNELYLQEEDLGKTLIVDVAAYEPIMASMITDEILTKDTREVEIGVANLMVDQQNLDYVDIRIMFPTGEDYVVIPKVKVKKLLLEDCIFYTNLNESQILTLASATIDAFTISGTKIYTTRYVESSLQDAAIPNYPVRDDILSLIATDPNVLEVAQQTLNYSARQVMEQKLAGLSEDYLKSVVAGHGIVDTANNSAQAERIADEQLEAEQQTENSQEVANE